jgi:AraC-like DNA-binding protein
MNKVLGNQSVQEVNMPTVDPDTVARLFTRVDVESSERINTRFVVSEMGDLTLIRSTHSSRNCVSHRKQRYIDGRDCSYVFACLPMDGHLRINHLGRQCTTSSGQVCFVTSDEEYTVEMSDHLDAMWLRVPTTRLQGHVASISGALGCALDVTEGIGRFAAQIMYTSLTTACQMSDRGARIVGQSVLSMFGELLDSQASAAARSQSSYCQKILGRARDYIDQHLGDEDLTPANIAMGIGISTRYLSQLFQAEGVSVMRWVQRRRLEQCRQELERGTPGRTRISEIAYCMGFKNVSGFNRAFKAHFGVSPSSMFRGH